MVTVGTADAVETAALVRVTVKLAPSVPSEEGAASAVFVEVIMVSGCALAPRERRSRSVLYGESIGDRDSSKIIQAYKAICRARHFLIHSAEERED